MYDIIKAVSLPPANFVLVILLGFLLRQKFKRLGAGVAVTAILVLYLLSTPFTASRLILALEAEIITPSHTVTGRPEVIVIPSAGYSYAGVKKVRADVDAMTLERLRAGVRLHWETGLPILVTGGGEKEGLVPVGTLMAQALRTDFGVNPEWVERRSTTTYENAKFSAQILKKQNISDIYLVSQAWHLPRAVAAFEAAGLSSTPVPSSRHQPARGNLSTIIPAADALQVSYRVFYEKLGLAWYRWALFGRN